MNNKGSWDIPVSLAIVVASALIYWDSLKLRPGSYDPLGSGTMPRMVAVAIVALCLVAVAQSLTMRFARRKRAAAAAPDFERRPWLAAAIFGYLVIGAAMLYLKVPFAITATLLVFASVLSIKRGERAIIIPAAACSAAFGFGLTYLFGAVFGVDLP